ncbi:hypothetical protein B0H10DRAFT_1940764 [Mycena sp. CBHHK59/15]|nr:hypothetical protein B0H10DRAFT_1940764 [Mycena sp. CBHHK59/15]
MCSRTTHSTPVNTVSIPRQSAGPLAPFCFVCNDAGWLEPGEAAVVDADMSAGVNCSPEDAGIGVFKVFLRTIFPAPKAALARARTCSDPEYTFQTWYKVLISAESACSSTKIKNQEQSQIAEPPLEEVLQRGSEAVTVLMWFSTFSLSRQPLLKLELSEEPTPEPPENLYSDCP